MTTLKELADRIEALEKGVGGTKKPKVPRAPSEYNLFVKKFFKDNSKSGKEHKELFKEASKAWTDSKKSEK